MLFVGWLRHLVYLAIATVIATMVMLAIPWAHAMAVPGVLYGIEENGGMSDASLRPQILDHQRGLGASIIRLQMHYDQIATCDPTTKGSATDPANPCYDWSTYDNVVKGATQRNMAVIFSVLGVPKWVFNDANPADTGNSPAQFAQFEADYADFITAAATRYDGNYAGIPRVNYWTIWNEPNGTYFWMPRYYQGDLVLPVRYAQLVDVATRRIKAVDANLLVAAGPLASTSPLKPATVLDSFLPELQKLGTPIDAWAQNAYTRKESPLHSHMSPPELGLGNLDDLTNLLDAYPQSKGLPIWITEFGYETAPDPLGVTMSHQATWLADSDFLVWSNPRVQMFMWYGLFDDGTKADPTSGFQTGLYQALDLCAVTWCPKPSAIMFQHPIWLDKTVVRAGKPVQIWGEGHVNPQKTRIYYWTNNAWHAFYNQPGSDGSIYITWSPPQTTWVVTCDTTCGLIRKITVK